MPESEFSEMELNGTSLPIDYYSIDELDPETLEDVEVALYGMIHHASNEEDFITNSENFPPPVTTPQKKEDKRIELPSCTIPETISKEKLTSFLNVESVQNSNSSTQERTKQFSKPDKRDKISSPTKPSSTRTIELNRQYNIKRNPYSQNLVIEESSTKQMKKNIVADCEIITLSDEEDSRYNAVNKSATKRISKMDYKGSTRNLNAFQSSPMASTISLTGDSDSDCSDSSIILLNPKPSSSKYLDETSSDSSDSDIQVLKSLKTNYDLVNLKLNVHQSDVHSSQMFTPCINTSASNSSWVQYSSAKWTPEMIKFYDKDGCDTDLQQILDSLPRDSNKWELIDEDHFGSSLQRNRYFGKSSKMRCANCNQWDHLAKHCREPRKICNCNICGMPGHKPFGCPKKICLGCGRPSKILIECCPECRRESKIVCMICHSKHVTQRCPDLWRRYHLTTREHNGPLKDTGTALKPDHLLFCCNCAGRGHLVHECPGKLWSKYPPADPSVVSYENSEDFLNGVTKNGNSSVAISENGKEIWVVGPSPDKSPKRGGRQWYYTSIDHSELTLRKAKSSVLQEIKHVEINWRKQPKKGRMLVEFTGKGNTKEAKKIFKKMITFQKKPTSTPARKDHAAQENPTPTTSKLEKGKILSSPNKKQASSCITAININHVSQEGKQLRRHIRLCLTEKQKRNIGKLLGKIEFKNRVQITSCYVGTTWEITIHKLEKGNSAAAFNAIFRYITFLDSPAARHESA